MRDFFMFLFAQDSINVLYAPVLALSVLLAVLFQRVKGRPVSDLLPPDWSSVRTDILLVLSGRLVLYGLQFLMPVVTIGTVAALLGTPGGLRPGPIGWAVFSVAQFLFADFVFWWVHWLRHRLSVLWAFHAVHHSAEYLNPITGYRRHPLEILWLSAALMTLNALPVLALVLIFPGVEAPGILLVTVANALFTVSISNLQHMQAWVTFGPVFERLFVSPAMHQIHHSRDAQESQHNFGQILALWDWAFSTLITSSEVDATALRFGVEGVRHQTLWEMFIDPLIEGWSALREGLAHATGGNR